MSAALRALGRTLLLLLACCGAATAAPTEAVHSLTWYVHDALIDVPAGRDLAYYTQLIQDRLAQAEVLVQGYQGPQDDPCCVGFDAPTVTTFSGAGLDVIETFEELDAVLGSGAGGYLVESVWYCGGFSTTVLGCAGLNGDSLVVGIDAEDERLLPLVMAHERGHNAGLYHVTNDPCELMAGGRGGGCLSASECSAYIADANAAGASCTCLGDAPGDPPLANLTACTDDFGSGVCSAGLCSASDGPAVTQLLFAGGSESSETGIPDDVLRQSPVAGGWADAGAIGGSVAAEGLAYDPGRGVVFAVAPQASGNDRLLRLDPETGALQQVVATLDHTGLIALAFDPGGDRLFAIQADQEIFGGPFSCPTSKPCVSALLEIDPDDGTTAVLGELNALIVDGGVQGLAWDSNAGVLFGTTGAGLFTIGISCGGGACPDTTQVDGMYRFPSSLAYDPSHDTLYRQGGMAGRTEFDVIDPATGIVEALIGVDGFTPGGMAATPLPEPAGTLQLGAGALLLATLARRRGVRRGPGA